ncbi:MAG: helix-turn-helix transcriptional regulator [Spirochaetales bacterium]|nr:helix-turn-helix transcriptional regulator [Spirochaetales bacterium]
MNHLYFFYFLITTLIGIVSVGIFCIAAIKARVKYVSYYLLFFISFSIVIVSEMIIVYLQLNLAESSLSTSGVLMCTSSSGVYLLLVFVPLLVHELTGIQKRKALDTVFIALSLIVFILAKSSALIKNLSLESPENFLLFPVLIYSLLLGFTNIRRIDNREKRIFARKWLLLVAFSLVLLILELLSGDTDRTAAGAQGIYLLLKTGKTLYPLIYAGFSVLFVHHFARHILVKSVPAENPDIRTVCNTYNLSSREKDVLLLILKGYSNTQIGKELFISIGTVKTHIGNIFRKIGVKQRAELLSLFITRENTAIKTDQT